MPHAWSKVSPARPFSPSRFGRDQDLLGLRWKRMEKAGTIAASPKKNQACLLPGKVQVINLH